MAYCKYGCPTGLVLSFVRSHGKADGFGRREVGRGAAGGCSSPRCTPTTTRFACGSSGRLRTRHAKPRPTDRHLTRRCDDRLAAGWLALRAAARGERTIRHATRRTDDGRQLVRPSRARRWTRAAQRVATRAPADPRPARRADVHVEAGLRPVAASTPAAARLASRSRGRGGGRDRGTTRQRRRPAGAFDVTVGPLVNLWGFGPTTRPPTRPRIPSDDAIAAARAASVISGCRSARRRPRCASATPTSTSTSPPSPQGYAADVVAARLDAAGVADHLVDVCGEIRAGGPAAHGGRGEWRSRRPSRTRSARSGASTRQTIWPWRPRATTRTSSATPSAAATATRSTRAPAGRSAHRLASVSVAHASAATADAPATALYGTRPGRRLRRTRNNTDSPCCSSCGTRRATNSRRAHAGVRIDGHARRAGEARRKQQSIRERRRRARSSPAAERRQKVARHVSAGLACGRNRSPVE